MSLGRRLVCAFPVKRTRILFSFSPPVSHLLTTATLSKWLNNSFQSRVSDCPAMRRLTSILHLMRMRIRKEWGAGGGVGGRVSGQ